MAALTERPILPELRPWVWPWLTAYQRAGIAKAVYRGDQLLYWTTGSGKTAAACVWAVAASWPVLAVVPSSVRGQWAAEVRRFTLCEPFVLYPRAERRANDMTLAEYLDRCRGLNTLGGWDVRPWLIVGHTALRDLEDEIDQYLAAGHVSLVWDEIHRFKNPKRTKKVDRPDGSSDYLDLDTLAARAGRLAPRATRRLGLTATMIPDRIRDVWAQLDDVKPAVLGKSFWTYYAARYCGAYEGKYGWITDGATNLPELWTHLQPYVHRVRKEELAVHLPPLRREIRWLDRRDLMSTRHRKYGKTVRAAEKTVKEAARAARGGTGLEALDEGVGGDAKEAFLASRLSALGLRKSPAAADRVREALESGLRVLCFTAERIHAEVIMELLGDVHYRAEGQETKSKVPIWCAHGEVTPRAREKIREDYTATDGSPAAIIGTGEAWGESHNLQTTDLLLIVTTPWTWRQMAQWEGRGDRLGRIRSLLIEYLGVEGSLEEKVLHKIMAKLKAIAGLDADAHVEDVRLALKGDSGDGIMDSMMDDLFGDSD